MIKVECACDTSVGYYLDLTGRLPVIYGDTVSVLDGESYDILSGQKFDVLKCHLEPAVFRYVEILELLDPGISTEYIKAVEPEDTYSQYRILDLFLDFVINGKTNALTGLEDELLLILVIIGMNLADPDFSASPAKSVGTFYLVSLNGGHAGKQCIFLSDSAHIIKIFHMDIVRHALCPYLTLVDPDRLVTELLYLTERVRNDNDRRAVLSYLLELIEALGLEVRVAYCEDLVDEKDIISGKDLAEGDVLIGIASSGVHSNGFSLVRKVFPMTRESLDTYYEELGRTLGEALIEPTRIYVKALAGVKKAGVRIKACSHITGGGFYENIPRMLREGTRAVVEKNSYEVPAIFKLLMKTGNIDEHMMYNTYNMGIGMVLAVDPEKVEDAIAAIREAGDQAYVIGRIAAGEKGVDLI